MDRQETQSASLGRGEGEEKQQGAAAGHGWDAAGGLGQQELWAGCKKGPDEERDALELDPQGWRLGAAQGAFQ